MSADQHPSLITDHNDPPALTLVLPGHLDADQTLRGLTEAISRTRADMVRWVRMFQQRLLDYAASGDQLRQAQCRGQVLAGEHAISHLDENIVEVLDLWAQYESQTAGPKTPPRPPSQPGRHLPSASPDRCQMPHDLPAARQHLTSLAGTHRLAALIPASCRRKGT
jgi:hypothetical protein